MYEKHDIPAHYLERWQKPLDIAAAIMEVPAALIMRFWPEWIESRHSRYLPSLIWIK